ncbi:hypothetical protein PISL3812_08269 [Talaromyces islandicus]|uniref:Chromate transport protein n=1 Tax=Talaromyces islandicus TaxID=28573 RepID=A0A0U1M832_TALIS|nr:hypothetical protein PISL3812_08269 [Talaromyces islandicus]
MYALSLGIQHINNALPSPVYGLLSGMNSSTVGIIALAAIQLAEKAIQDKFSRILVIFGACAGMCYNSLWYFPLLMAMGGLAAVIWDGWMRQGIRELKTRLKRNRVTPEVQVEEASATNDVPLGARPAGNHGVQRRNPIGIRSSEHPEPTMPPHSSALEAVQQQHSQQNSPEHAIRARVGIAIVALFFASFIGILVARGTEPTPPIALDLFASMYLAGTIIFGGGPVVIPLLRSYVVSPGWVSSRDFLIGLAIIQAFPGPNFNFAVYLGALAFQSSKFPTIFGAFLAFLGIFFPGIALAVAVQSFWRILRKRRWVTALLRGVNATAVGLVFTAVYRLWEIGYLTSQDAIGGQSLGKDAWWVVVATVTYAESAWFDVPPAVAIVMGAVLGLCWYGAVGRE